MYAHPPGALLYEQRGRLGVYRDRDGVGGGAPVLCKVVFNCKRAAESMQASREHIRRGLWSILRIVRASGTECRQSGHEYFIIRMRTSGRERRQLKIKAECFH